MVERHLVVGLMVFLLSSCSQSGYRNMMNDFESYRPPAYMHLESKESMPKAQSYEDNAFMAEKQRIEAAAARWEQSLNQRESEAQFFLPDPKRMAALEPASTDSSLLAEHLEKKVSLPNLEVLILLRNPGVRAAERRFRASIQGLSQITALDEILRRYTAFTEDLQPGVGPMKGRDPLSLKFPFPGILALKGEIAQQEVWRAREELEMARRDAVTSVRVAFWNLLYNSKARQITIETLDLLSHLEEVATARYEAGKTSFQDVIKVRIELDILQEAMISLREMKRNLETEILGLFDMAPRNALGPPEAREPSRDIPSLEVLYESALANRQELRRVQAVIGKMERMIEMAETMILPKFTLDLSLYEDEAIKKVGPGATKETFPVAVSASRGKGLPKDPWFGTGEAYLKETEERLRARKADLVEMERTTVTMVRKAWFTLDKAARNEFLYREKIVKNARAALDVSTSGYESGNVTFADVISSYKLWLDANLARYKKRSDLGIAWAELEKSVGATLRGDMDHAGK
jgi:outer membrane protein TolC